MLAALLLLPQGLAGAVWAADSCAEQLAADGCVPTAGTHKCADCAEHHKSDLEKARCSEAFVLKWCEGQVPPHGGDCGVKLTKQLSSHVNCTRGVTFGCRTDSSSRMWVAQGCRGVFACAGAAGVECDSGRSENKTCDCKASPPPPPPKPKPPPPPPINASTVTVMVFGDSWGSLGPGWHEIQVRNAASSLPQVH
jgi:hypothetical protein